MRRAIRFLILGCLTVTLTAGCSRIQLAYNAADFLLERYADDYLSLDAAQLDQWRPTLTAALDRHRLDELPYLAAFFNSALEDTRQGFNAENVGCLLDQAEVIYERQFRLASAAVAPLLADLTKAQIDALQRDFYKEARADASDDEPASVAKRMRKRARRYEDNMQWWIGDLTPGQKQIVDDVTRSMPDSARAWYDYRDAQRQALIRLLRQGAGARRIEAFMASWLVEYRDLPPTLRNAHRSLRRGLTDLMVRLDPTLTPAQRQRLIQRLTALRDDFMALQKRPRMAPTAC